MTEPSPAVRAAHEAVTKMLGQHGPSNLYHYSKKLLRDSDDEAARALAKLVLELVPDPYGCLWPPSAP